MLLFPVTQTLDQWLLPTPLSSKRNGGDDYLSLPDAHSHSAVSAAPAAPSAAAVTRRKVTIRVCVVGITCVVSMVCESISLWSSLVGAFFLTLVGYALPAVLHLSMHKVSTPDARSPSKHTLVARVSRVSRDTHAHLSSLSLSLSPCLHHVCRASCPRAPGWATSPSSRSG